MSLLGPLLSACVCAPRTLTRFGAQTARLFSVSVRCCSAMSIQKRTCPATWHSAKLVHTSCSILASDNSPKDADTLKTLCELVLSPKATDVEIQQSVDRAVLTHYEWNHTGLSVAQLIWCLRRLLNLYTEDLPIITSLQQHVIQESLIPHYRQMLFATYHGSVYKTEQRNAAMQALWESVRGDWVSINHPKTLMAYLYMAESCGDTNLIHHMEVRIRDLTHILSVNDAIKILTLFSRQPERPSFGTLMTLGEHILSQEPLGLGLQHLASLTHVCAKLGFSHGPLLASICRNMQQLSGAIPTRTVLHLLNCFSALRWCDPASVDLLANSLRVEDVPHHSLHILPVTCARLAYIPAALFPVFHQIAQRVLNEEGPARTKVLLDMAWSGAVLGCLTEQMAAAVLHPDFTEQCREGGLLEHSVTAMKLQNVDAYVRSLLPSYTGPTLSQDVSYQANTQEEYRPLLEAAAKALCKNKSLKEYCNFNVHLPIGYNIDIELLVDSEGVPQPLSSDVEGLTRIAMTLLPRGQQVLGPSRTLHPTGHHNLASRLLAVRSITHILVSIGDYKSAKDKTSFLQEKVKESVTGAAQATSPQIAK